MQATKFFHFSRPHSVISISIMMRICPLMSLRKCAIAAPAIFRSCSSSPPELRPLPIFKESGFPKPAIFCTAPRTVFSLLRSLWASSLFQTLTGSSRTYIIRRRGSGEIPGEVFRKRIFAIRYFLFSHDAPRSGHPLIPPAVTMPLIICFCASMYTSTTGINAISVPAISKANEVLCSA